MAKLIAYSLFKSGEITEENLFEHRAYIRGFYWNIRMNNLLYPDWRIHVEIDKYIHDKYRRLFDWLVENANLSLNINWDQDKPDYEASLCEAMLWRIKPIFTPNITHVLCRDADAITTYREAQCVQAWLESGLGFHAINDNPVHGGLMGGMIGFNTAKFKAMVATEKWEDIVKDVDLSKRGSDQNLLNKDILSVIKDDLYLSTDMPRGNDYHLLSAINNNYPIPQVDRRLWESNLTCRHIGSAGVVDMEVLRFFKRFDEYNWKYRVIEKEYPEVFYWQIN